MTSRNENVRHDHPIAIVAAAVCLLLTLLIQAANGQSTSMPGRRYAAFFENGLERGVAGSWNGVDWSNLPCPPQNSQTNRVNTFVNVSGDIVLTNAGQVPTWVQLGHQKKKPGDTCDGKNIFYWERQYVNADGSINYAFSRIDTPSDPLNTHRYALSRRDTGCQSGISWCWHFDVDGISHHTCCGEQGHLDDSSNGLSAQVECIWYNSGYGGCPAQGLIDTIYNLNQKQPDGTWPNWNDRDYACVDDFANMRGKWENGSDNNVKGGANVTITLGVDQDCV